MKDHAPIIPPPRAMSRISLEGFAVAVVEVFEHFVEFVPSVQFSADQVESVEVWAGIGH